MLGIVTRQNACQPLAPSTIAASSLSVPCASMKAMSSRATNGKGHKRLSRGQFQGVAKMIFQSRAISHSPKTP
jgi:hypothetical protein